MRFAAEQAYSRSVIEAELTFGPLFSNEGLIFTSTKNFKIQTGGVKRLQVIDFLRESLPVPGNRNFRKF